MGPDPDGRIPFESVERLRAMGRWLDVYGESIYGSEPTADRLRISSAGRTHTKIGATLYLHCWRWPGEEIVVGGVGGRILGARLLGSDLPVAVEQRGHRVWLRGLPAYAPDPIDTVIALEFDGTPEEHDRFGDEPGV